MHKNNTIANRISLITIAFALCQINSGSAEETNNCTTLCSTPLILDFETATQRALTNSSQLKIAETDISARAADQKQASLYPNPIFSYTIDDIGTGRRCDGWNASESTFEIDQLVELGGKRQLRKKLSRRDYEASLVDYQITQIHVLNQLSKAFVEVAAAQESFKLAQEQTQICQEALRVIKEKVTNGKLALIQQHKSEIECSTAELEQENALAELMAAKERLALSWGSRCPDFDAVVYPFFDIHCPISLDECLECFYSRPELARAQLNCLRAYAAVELEKSARIPDVSLMVGYTTAPHSSDQGFAFGVAFPLPIFDRNQGNIARAHSEVFKSQEEAKLITLLLESKYSLMHKEFVQSYREAEKIRTTILKSATHAYELAVAGHKEGKYDYLELLEAQGMVFQIKERYIEALANYHKRKADLEFLVFDE